jgi:uncharacterized membrane protein YeiH
MDLAAWSLAADLAGVFFFAVSGSILAAERHFDIVGSVLLGSLTGLGGGVIRDLILGRPPIAFANPAYFAAPLVAAAMVFLLLRVVQRFRRTLLIFDAGGLALFCVTGTAAALQYGANPVSATLLGATTAVGGGLLRDVVANETPHLFDPNDLYAVPALLGAAATAIFGVTGSLNLATGALAAAAVFALRILALRFHWRVPMAAATVRHRRDRR